MSRQRGSLEAAERAGGLRGHVARGVARRDRAVRAFRRARHARATAAARGIAAEIALDLVVVVAGLVARDGDVTATGREGAGRARDRDAGLRLAAEAAVDIAER